MTWYFFVTFRMLRRPEKFRSGYRRVSFFLRKELAESHKALQFLRAIAMFRRSTRWCLVLPSMRHQML